MIDDLLNNLVEAWGVKLAASFVEAVALMTRRVQVQDVVAKLEAGDVEGAVRALAVDPVLFRQLERAVADAFEAGGQLAAGRARSPVTKLDFLFNSRDPVAETWLRSHSAGLVRSLVETQRDAARQFLAANMAAGNNPRTTALDLVGRVNRSTGKRVGGVLGLTPNQEEWSRAYEAELAAANPAALRRELRDRRFDRRLEKSVKLGEPLPADVRARMVQAYRNKALKLRGEAVGRTEAKTALHKSQDLAFRQAVSSGHVDKADVRKVWRSSEDERVRATHRHLNGHSVGLDEPFVSSSGARLMFPGDPDAPADERILCRCACEYRVDYLANYR